MLSTYVVASEGSPGGDEFLHRGKGHLWHPKFSILRTLSTDTRAILKI